eukprot:TRINITY_DN35279_c0_g1_i1.p1 TRINITY_DN35279_c0_g1~~TRINITY_DN35279_c0_g1_i1.p1  ORF type:complete len:311 (+),score=56.77 TRINITY_DN35279_c0_g1_i1:65-934(+)
MKWTAEHLINEGGGDDPAAAEDDDAAALEELEKKLDMMEARLGELRGLEKEIMELPEVLPRCGSAWSELPTMGTVGSDGQEYVVVSVMGKKRRASDGAQLYLCLWSNGGGLSWEPEEDIEAVNLIERYENSRKKKWEEVLQRQHQVSRQKFALRATARGWTYRSKQKETPGAPPDAATSEYDRLMHLDIPALRVYLQTVTEFTPLHYDLLLRLSEEDVSRGCSAESLKKLRPATPAELENPQNTTCSVCLDEFDPTPPTILPCGHLFHTDCITSWLGQEKTCPLCKAEV